MKPERKGIRWKTGQMVALWIVVVGAMGASAPVYLTTERGAYSEYAMVSTLILPFGTEVTRRSTYRLSIEREENDGQERNLWVKQMSIAGKDSAEVLVRVKASALASVPAVSDDLEPLVDLIESISGLEVRVNDREVMIQERVEPPRLKAALSFLRPFLELKVEPGKKDRVKTPVGKLGCQWWEISGRVTTPKMDFQKPAKMDLKGKVCVSGEVPFRWVKWASDWTAVFWIRQGQAISLEGHHEGTLTDYQPRGETEAPPARPATPLP